MLSGTQTFCYIRRYDSITRSVARLSAVRTPDSSRQHTVVVLDWHHRDENHSLFCSGMSEAHLQTLSGFLLQRSATLAQSISRI